MEEAQFQFRNAILSYQKAGSGSEALLQFHGFGQDRTAFDSLLSSLGTRYTIYSFDLFFHGNSEWGHGEHPLEKAFVAEMMNAFLESLSIDRFSVMGFSLGGKVAFTMAETMTNRINTLYLMAPDGISTQFWYSLATYPLVFRKYFRGMITHPGYFSSVVKLASKLRLVDRGVLRFANSQMNTEEKRRRVYLTWVVYRHLKFDLPQLARKIAEQQAKLVMIVGRFDKIITATNVKGFVAQIPSGSLHIVDAGHNDLIAKSGSVL
ncbi:MAG: alpha/beta fold hydrolase [Cyclobacteriaceae bacterium]